MTVGCLIPLRPSVLNYFAIVETNQDNETKVAVMCFVLANHVFKRSCLIKFRQRCDQQVAFSEVVVLEISELI